MHEYTVLKMHDTLGNVQSACNTRKRSSKPLTHSEALLQAQDLAQVLGENSTVVLVGSRATGMDTKESDVDFMLQVRAARPQSPPWLRWLPAWFAPLCLVLRRASQVSVFGSLLLVGAGSNPPSAAPVAETIYQKTP